MKRSVRIANVSGFYGDRTAAFREMLDGPEHVDVITGDYLAELTMLILWKARRRDPSMGYATTFASQMEDCLAGCLEKGIRVVTNAGGLNPHGLAERLRDSAARAGLSPRIAIVEGDDIVHGLGDLQASGERLFHLDTGMELSDAGVEPVTANAYLGGFGIARALQADADIVIATRVTDAALAVGPAVWWHGWAQDDLDCIAGAVVAGHIIECGPQATGGNYSFADEETADLRRPGYPIAEIAADGSCVVTKQPGTGGAVTVGTVTAQLLYEVAGPAYANPDVVARFDTIQLRQLAADRVEVSGVRGEAPTGRLKVAINYLGGWRNTMTIVLTGEDHEAKERRAVSMLGEVLGGWEQFEAVDLSRRWDELRITVKDRDRTKVGRRFSNGVIELLLASYAGAYATTPPTDASEYGVYWPTMVPCAAVEHAVVLPDGRRVIVPHPAPGPGPRASPQPVVPIPMPIPVAPWVAEPAEPAPLARVCGARSGDKGGNANVGVWTRDALAFRWLRTELTVERFQELLPETAGLVVQRFELANIHALNFVVVGLLGEGVASSTRVDPQAKSLGEQLRAQIVPIPISLIHDRTGLPGRNTT